VVLQINRLIGLVLRLFLRLAAEISDAILPELKHITVYVVQLNIT